MTEPRLPRIRGNRWLRFLDRYVGIPVVAALGAIRSRRAFDPSRVKRIGLMKTVAIGDTVLITGIARDVKAKYPATTVVAISGVDNRGVVELVPEFDERIVVSPHDPITSVAAVRAAKLDVLLDFGAWPRFDAALAAMSGAGFVVGFESAGQGRHFPYDVAIHHSNDVHEIENFRRIARAIDVESKSPPRLSVPASVAPGAAKPYVVFHPWPGGYRRDVKEWSVERWASLAAELTTRGYTIVLSGGPADVPRSAHLADRLRRAGVSVADLAGRQNVRGAAQFYAAAACVVSVNTGIMHLAAAVGAPTVSLDGPTSAARWGPVGDRVRSVESTFPGCGYLNLGWEYEGERLDCMAGVPVEAVVEAVAEIAR